MMVFSARYISQPYSGEYIEKIYDIKSRWNSGDWSWVLFEDEKSVWCGEFRGSFRGVALSEKLQIIVVLTSDYMYVLDIETSEVMDYRSQPPYVDITTTPSGDILVTDGYGVDVLKGKKLSDIDCITVVSVHPDNLRFQEYVENRLRIICYELGVWDKEIELYLDCNTLEWIDG